MGSGSPSKCFLHEPKKVIKKRVFFFPNGRVFLFLFQTAATLHCDVLCCWLTLRCVRLSFLYLLAPTPKIPKFRPEKISWPPLPPPIHRYITPLA